MTFKKKLKLTSLMYVGTKKKYSKKSTDSMGNLVSVKVFGGRGRKTGPNKRLLMNQNHRMLEENCFLEEHD